MSFNERLAKFRKDLGLTQEEIASYLHRSRQAISKWERGETEPSLYDLKQLALLFNCSLEDLVGDKKGSIEGVPRKGFKIAQACNLFLFIAFIGLNLLIYIFAEDLIPAHATFNEIDRYGSRLEILILPLFLAVSFIIYELLYHFKLSKVSFGSGQQERHCEEKNRLVLAWLPTLGILIFSGVTTFLAFTMYFHDGVRSFEEVRFQVIALIIGLTVIFCGTFMHPYFNRRNVIFGLRTAYALSCEKGWRILNALGSYIMNAAGLIIMIIATVLSGAPVLYCFISVLAAMMVAMIVGVVIVTKKGAKD